MGLQRPAVRCPEGGGRGGDGLRPGQTQDADGPRPGGVATAAMVSVVLSIRTILLPGGALRQETQRFLQKIFLCKVGGKIP